MFLKRIFNRFRSLSFRLAAIYTLVFSGSFFIGLAVTYLLISTYIIREEIEAELEGEVDEVVSFIERGGREKMLSFVQSEAQGEGIDYFYFLVYTKDGSKVFSSDLRFWPDVELKPGTLSRAASGKRVLETLPARNGKIRARILTEQISSDWIAQIGMSMEKQDAMLARLKFVFTIMTLCMGIVGALVGWFMGKRAMRGVENVTQVAASIAEGKFNQRVSLNQEGMEIDCLATTFNTMADRIEALMKEMREVNDNIAHDLRSPITRMRGTAETMLASGFSLQHLQELAGSVVEECDFLLGIINTMLDISEIEAGVSYLRYAEVDLCDLVRDGVELFKPVAEEKGITLMLEELPKSLKLKGDLSRLQRVFSNIFDNALKHTPAGTKVTITVSSNENSAKVSVTDNGPGIPEKELPRIFNRFYRADNSRSNPGSGLGLSLALAIVKAHGGNITVESTAGKGCTFAIILPRDGKSPPGCR